MIWLWRIALTLCIPFAAWGGTNDYTPFAYKTDFATVQSLGRDLYHALSPEQRRVISPEPVLLERSPRPSIHFRYSPGATPGAIYISSAFVQLVNQLAHAKAIDRARKGYLKHYLKQLQEAENSVPPLPEANTPAFWTEDMLNEQRSNFNSIIGVVLGINLAHLYLGHYEKYRAMLDGPGETAPINTLLSRDEWEESYRAGVRDSMSAGCMVEGAIPFFESLDRLERLKHYPSWIAFFIPDHFRFEHMRKEMVKLQGQFLRVN